MTYRQSEGVTDRQLLSLAKKAGEKAYCPYSKFSVGAALLTRSGEVYCGANIESSAFISNCAERTALFSAVFAGERDFDAIAVATPYTQKPCPPCGLCRQMLSEFCGGDLRVILENENGEPEVHSFADLFPMAFEM